MKHYIIKTEDGNIQVQKDTITDPERIVLTVTNMNGDQSMIYLTELEAINLRHTLNKALLSR